MRFDGFAVVWLLCLVVQEATGGRVRLNRLARWAVRGIDRHERPWEA